MPTVRVPIKRHRGEHSRVSSIYQGLQLTFKKVFILFYVLKVANGILYLIISHCYETDGQVLKAGFGKCCRKNRPHSYSKKCDPLKLHHSISDLFRKKLSVTPTPHCVYYTKNMSKICLDLQKPLTPVFLKKDAFPHFLFVTSRRENPFEEPPQFSD